MQTKSCFNFDPGNTESARLDDLRGLNASSCIHFSEMCRPENIKSLKSILWHTGSQCRDLRFSVTCSTFLFGILKDKSINYNNPNLVGQHLKSIIFSNWNSSVVLLSDRCVFSFIYFTICGKGGVHQHTERWSVEVFSTSKVENITAHRPLISSLSSKRTLNGTIHPKLKIYPDV